MHLFDPHWFAKSVTWKLTDASKAVMGKRWCRSIDDRQREAKARADAAQEGSSSDSQR